MAGELWKGVGEAALGSWGCCHIRARRLGREEGSGIWGFLHPPALSPPGPFLSTPGQSLCSVFSADYWAEKAALDIQSDHGSNLYTQRFPLQACPHIQSDKVLFLARTLAELFHMKPSSLSMSSILLDKPHLLILQLLSPTMTVRDDAPSSSPLSQPSSGSKRVRVYAPSCSSLVQPCSGPRRVKDDAPSCSPLVQFCSSLGTVRDDAPSCNCSTLAPRGTTEPEEKLSE